MDILSQMMRLPFTLVAKSVEPFLEMARDADTYTYERRPSAPMMMPRTGGLPAPSMASLQPSFSGGAGYAPPPPAPAPSAPSLASVLGAAAARGDDLGDNMVKVVQSWIVWTKPDEERPIEGPTTKIVAYPSNPISIAAQVLLKWASDRTDDIRNGRPVEPKVVEILSAPEDWRYLQVKTEVIQRYAAEEKHYDKLQTRAQQKIASELGGLDQIADQVAKLLGAK